MSTIDINDLASIGVVRDTPPFQLPPEAWSLGLNVRAVDGGIERIEGWDQVFGTPLVAPHFAIAISTAAQDFWVYVSLTKASGYDGSTHSDITRAVGGDYTATNTSDWNGTILGGVLVLNNGADVPQFWVTPALATRLSNLTNWPATWRAKVMRAFGPFLVAFGLTKGGVLYPHLVQWSHPADPGSVPVSWDDADPTKDTGKTDLPDVQSGVILEALPLQSQMYIYKQGAVWRMSSTRGRFVFDFKTFLETVGILGPRCVALTGDGLRHVVATQDDIIWHNGNTVHSILTKRMKRYLFNEIDTVNFANSFMYCNPAKNEMRFCYPSQGQTHPDKELIWNYAEGQEGAITEADGVTYRNAAIGPVETADEATWEDGTQTWEEEVGPWSEINRRRVVLSAPAATKLYGLDRTSTRDGAAFTATLQREGLALIGRKRSGEWIVDHEIMKMLKRVWPKMSGGPVNVRLGSQQTVGGPISWSNAVTFDPASQTYVDFLPVSGRAVGVEISSSAAVSWRIDGYKVDIEKLGNY